MEGGINNPKLLYQYSIYQYQRVRMRQESTNTVPASHSSCDRISHTPGCHRNPSQPPNPILESSKVHSALSSVQNSSSTSSVGLPRPPPEPRIIHFHRCNILPAWPVQSLWDGSPFVRQYYSSATLLIPSLLLIMTSSPTSPARKAEQQEAQSIDSVTV